MGQTLTIWHFLQPVAAVLVELGHQLADDAQVIEGGLDAVVGAAAAGDLELVGQLDAVVAQVEPLVDLLAEGEGVIEAVLAGGALAGDHGPDQGAGTAGNQTGLGDELLKRGNIVIVDAPDLHGQTGGELHVAVAELLGGFGDDGGLLGGDLAVDGDDAGVKEVGSLVVFRKPISLDAA